MIPECVDVVEDKALIFQKSDVNSLYTKLVDICCNSSKVQSFKRTAEEFVCNKYSWIEKLHERTNIFRFKRCRNVRVRTIFISRFSGS